MKNKGFLISEVLIATILLVTFLFGVYKFFNVQNKNMDYLIKEYNAVNLSEDAMITLMNFDYKKLIDGYYSVFYEEKSIFEGEYKIRPITTTNSVYEEGKFVDKNGFKINYNPSEENISVYKIIIQVSPELNTSIGQKYKNVSINIWHPECEFEGLPCVIKNFILTQKNEYK